MNSEVKLWDSPCASISQKESVGLKKKNEKQMQTVNS